MMLAKYVVWSVVALHGAVGTGGVRRAAEPSSGRSGPQDSTWAVLGALPPTRPLGVVPPVDDVGQLLSPDGHVVRRRVTPSTAVTDLDVYALQLASLVSYGANGVSDDSVAVLRTARAAAWVAHLRALHPAVADRDLLVFAQVAWRAGDDGLAKQLIDQRLAETGSGVRVGPGERTVTVEQSVTLMAAVDIFTTPARDSARVVRNIATATAYADRLFALRVRGVPSISDSTAVLDRQMRAARMLLFAAAARADAAPLGVPGAAGPLLSAIGRYLVFISRFPPAVRLREVNDFLPYRSVAMALATEPNGRAQLDSLERRILTTTAPTGDNAPGRASAHDPQNVGRRQTVLAQFADIRRIGTAASPIFAHAWLNTADSTYAEAPREHAFNDGVIRILAFGERDNPLLPVLDRLYRTFAPRTNNGTRRVDVVYVTETTGAAGPDVVGPADEVTWLARYYKDRRGWTFPIAVWAGPIIAGDYGMHSPTPSTVRETYHTDRLESTCLVVDGHGIIRAYVKLRTHADEARLVDYLDRLVGRA